MGMFKTQGWTDRGSRRVMTEKLKHPTATPGPK
ncbi:hypothetical protein BV95_02072 [Sphingobium chlorophenolicum]|uniref:Uncharacterized protein n=1 Tax=Sphingobium chlorophenolicum TaxID=46429 RepID=A0A081REP9_SPHCR|nr:hypothetical protein BV95_02072 [Sphingobium chlorophenolicum]